MVNDNLLRKILDFFSPKTKEQHPVIIASGHHSDCGTCEHTGIIHLYEALANPDLYVIERRNHTQEVHGGNSIYDGYDYYIYKKPRSLTQ